LLEEIGEVERGGAQFLLHAAGIVFGDGLGGFFDKAHDIAHAEDAACKAVGVEDLELLKFFARACEFDRLTCDRAEREGGAATGITVELGEDDAGKAKGGMEALGDAYGLLSSGSIANDEDFLRLKKIAESLEFLDEWLIEFLSASGIENLHIAACGIAPVQCLAGNLKHMGLAFFGAENRNIDLPAENGELVDSGGPMEVASNEEGRAALRFSKAGQLGRGGGFSRAIEAHDENARGLVEIELRGVASEECAEFLVEDFYDLLAGGYAAENSFAKGLFLDLGYEILRNLEVDIGIEQGEPNLSECVGDIRFADLALAAEVFENILKFIRESAKHGTSI
jgi:hypothetical protein